MQLPRLELTNTQALLGIEHQRTTTEIRQPNAKITMNQPKSDVEIIKTKGKLEIDQSEAFADANLKNPLRLTKEWAQRAKQKLLQNLSKEMSEGRRLMEIEKQKESVIPQIAKENSEIELKEIGLGFMPKSAEQIKFYYEPSELKIKVNTENLKIDVKTHQPIIKFNPGDLHIYLKQKASLHIQVIGTTIDQKI